MSKNSKKVKELGQYYTDFNPFNNPPFKIWFKNALKKSKGKVLEPFAGSNNLIRMLEETYDFTYESFDIEPGAKDVKKRDTLKNYPKGFSLAITNPPYLARVSASRRGFYYPASWMNDMYKESLLRMLDNNEYVAAIIPASFIRANIFKERLHSYILLNKKMFETTDVPVCLVLFSPETEIRKTNFYKLNKNQGKTVQQIESWIKNRYKEPVSSIKFNTNKGNLGLRAVDSSKGKTMRFVMPSEILGIKMKKSSRHISKIKISKRVTKTLVEELNKELEIYRNETSDLFLNPFMGMRKDGDYRRRLDFKTAKKIINKVINE